MTSSHILDLIVDLVTARRKHVASTSQAHRSTSQAHCSHIAPLSYHLAHLSPTLLVSRTCWTAVGTLNALRTLAEPLRLPISRTFGHSDLYALPYTIYSLSGVCVCTLSGVGFVSFRKSHSTSPWQKICHVMSCHLRHIARGLRLKSLRLKTKPDTVLT